MANFNGTTGSDTINGTDGIDTIDFSQGGTDTVNALGSDDELFAGAALDATDRINGGSGHDALEILGDYSAGVTLSDLTLTSIEELRFGAGFDYDITIGGFANMYVDATGLSASDTLVLDASAHVNGFLIFAGSAASEHFVGAGDDDTFDLGSGGGIDTLIGGEGEDRFFFSGGFTTADFVDGGADFDQVFITGDSVTDLTLTLGAATLENVERITFGLGDDYTITTQDSLVDAGATLQIWANNLIASQVLAFNGAAETDGRFEVLAGYGNDTIRTGAGDDVLHGLGGGDTLDGGKGDDDMFGGDGNDGFRGGVGFDDHDGGDGSDGVNFDLSSGVNVFLDGSGTNGKAAAGDTFTNVENVNGSETGADFLVGDAAGNRLTGNGGADILYGRAEVDQLEGGAGNDRLVGGAGNDVLVGGADADRFVFLDAPAAGGLDRTGDFTHLLDKIEIDASAFGGGLVAGGAVQLVANANPTSAGKVGGVFLYDTDSGFLSFDADGGGEGAAAAFFRLQNLPVLTAADFVVVA